MEGEQMSNKFRAKVTRAPFRGDKTTSMNVSIQNKKTDGSTWTQYADVVMSNQYLPTVPGEGQYIDVEYDDLPTIRTYDKRDGSQGYTLKVWASSVGITLPDDIPHTEVEDDSLPF